MKNLRRNTLIITLSLLSVSFSVADEKTTETPTAPNSAEQAPSKAAPQQSAKPQGMPVEIIEIQPQTATITQDLPGRVSAYRTAEVRARATGIIQKRVFQEGSDVRSGDVLFKIENTGLKATLRARKADIAQAEAAYKLSQQTLKRYKKLLKMGAVSRQEYDQFSAQHLQNRAVIEQAKANYELAKINLDYATVTAPISGRVDKALVTEGGLVSANTTQLATIEQIDKVYVDFTRSSSELSKLRQIYAAQGVSDTSDRAITITHQDGTALEEKGYLAFSSMKVNESTGAITLRAVVGNPDYELLPGMFVRVKVPVADAEEVIEIPQKAVVISPQGTIVFTIENNQLKPLPIVLGPMADENWIIKSGLKAGDKIVLSSVTMLPPGTPVQGFTAEQLAAMQAQMKAAQAAQQGKQPAQPTEANTSDAHDSSTVSTTADSPANAADTANDAGEPTAQEQ